MRGESPPLTVRALRADEAAALVACVRRCYGESHVDPGLYDVPALAKAFAQGRRHSAVALTGDGQVVAHMGIALRRPGDRTADVGLTLVDPDWRGRGLARQVAVEISRTAQRLELLGLHDYPVTVHAATQRLGAGHGASVGFLLDHIPGDVRFEAMQTGATDATPSLVRYLPARDAPQRTVWLPERYAALARHIYSDSRAPRQLSATTARAHSRNPVDFSHTHDPRRELTRIVVKTCAGDRTALEDFVSAPTQLDVLNHLDLPLSDPKAAELAERLRAHGFSLGALLPEFRDGDVLRLQRLARGRALGDAPVLESEGPRELAAFVRADAEAVRAGLSRPKADAAGLR